MQEKDRCAHDSRILQALKKVNTFLFFFYMNEKWMLIIPILLYFEKENSNFLNFGVQAYIILYYTGKTTYEYGARKMCSRRLQCKHPKQNQYPSLIFI